MRFGFLPFNYEIATNSFIIKTIDDYKNNVEMIENFGIIDNNWIYPCGIYKKEIIKACEGYQLPATHELIIKNNSNDELERHIIQLFGFLNGIRLYPEGNNYFYKTPCKKSELVGFYSTGSEMEYIIKNEIINYTSRKQEQNILLFSAIHWFLFGQCYTHEFEKFDAQYRVSDCIYKFMEITGFVSKTHASRIRDICKKKNIPEPSWAIPSLGGTKNSAVSKLRNELYHEAKFAGEPIGYGFPNEKVVFELTLLNERLLLLLLGCESSVLHQSVENFRARYGLDLKLTS